MKNTRRKFSAAFKAEVALEAIKGIKTISEISQEYGLHPVQVTQWKKEFLEHITSHQLLRCIDSFLLRNPPLRQAPNR